MTPGHGVSFSWPPVVALEPYPICISCFLKEFGKFVVIIIINSSHHSADIYYLPNTMQSGFFYEPILSFQQPNKVWIMITILKVKKLRVGEINVFNIIYLVSGKPGMSTQVCSIPEPMPLITGLKCFSTYPRLWSHWI